MPGFFEVKSYIHHLRQAKKPRAFHSPYLFKLFTYCCNEEVLFPEFNDIEEERRDFLKLKGHIQRTDFGAGTISGADIHSINNIASKSLSLPYQCRFLARLVRFAKAKKILELGTSLGISAAYMASGDQSSKVVTVEGDPVVSEIARQLFARLDIQNVQVVNEKFDDYLRHFSEDTLDLIFLDGHHQRDPLLRYFEHLKPSIAAHTIVVVDDIHWSADMAKGWNELVNDPIITQSVDCYHFGLLFFNPDFLNKENHSVRLPLKSLFK